MGHKKTNTAWFGDTFNRPYTMSFATADGNEYTCAVNNMTVEHDLEGSCSISADVSSIAKGATLANSSVDYCTGYASVNIQSDVDVLVSQVKELQARIHELEVDFKPKNSGIKLRAELKTLAYNREV